MQKLLRRIAHGISRLGEDHDVERVLRHAEGLKAENKWREAIEFLSASNRDHAQVEIEKYLVDLFLQAADNIDFPATATAPPVAAPMRGNPTLENAQHKIPEISAQQLCADSLRQAVRDHGHLIVRDFMPQASAQLVKESIDHALVARVNSAQAGVTSGEDSPWYYSSRHFPGTHVSYSKRNSEKKFSRTGSMPVVDSPRGLFNVLEIYRQLGLADLLGNYFAEQPLIATRKWMFRLATPLENVDDGIGGGWHQDGQFMGESIRTINLWVALSPCGDTTAAPGIALIPRRLDEILEYGTRGARLNWTVGPELVAEIAQQTPMVRPRFEPGDALFFDHLSLHRTGHAPAQTRNRYALESWFYAASSHSGRPVMPLF
jgi:hypothetical protein